MCHHGMRSARALQILESAGFSRVRNLTGGIHAWSVQVDPSIPQY
jgi:rhodanese-related sulfurtransferase